MEGQGFIISSIQPPPVSSCANCNSSPAPISQIQLFSPSRELEKSISVIGALSELFPTSNSLIAKASHFNVKMCLSCSESLSYMYQHFIGFLQKSNKSSYVQHLISHLLPNSANSEPGSQPFFQLEIKNPNFEVKPHFEIIEEPPSESFENDMHDEIDIQDLDNSIREKEDIDKNGDVKKRKGRYICRNINRRRYFQCNECDAKFLPVYELHEHILDQHKNETREKCENCPFTYFPKIYKIDTHECSLSLSDNLKNKKSSKRRSFPCQICSASFGGHRELVFHIETTHVQENVRNLCHICNKVTVDRHKLYMHLEVHSPTKSYLCFECGKGFAQKRGLDKHRLIHEVPLEHRSKKGKSKFQCQKCTKVFSYQRNLSQHIKHYHLPRLVDYKCDFCEKTHIAKSRLMTHMKKKHPEQLISTNRTYPNLTKEVRIILRDINLFKEDYLKNYPFNTNSSPDLH